MNESRSQQQRKKSEAYDSAARDTGAPAVVLARPYLDEVRGFARSTAERATLMPARLNTHHDHTQKYNDRTLGAARGPC